MKSQSEDGKLAVNVVHFARTLRAAGLPVGPGRVLDALRAVEVVGIERRDDFYATLHAVFVSRREHKNLFDQAFHIFWRNPEFLERMMSMVLPAVQLGESAPKSNLSPRLSEALSRQTSLNQDKKNQDTETIELDAAMTFNSEEILRQKDFEEMTLEELGQVKAMMQDLQLPIEDIVTRRFRPDARGNRVDMQATLRASLRYNGDFIPLHRRSRRHRSSPLIVLCDISGSMERYSRMFLHFLHAIINDRDRVHSFLFGTRLTNVTRYLKHRDVDVAIKKVTEAVVDWSGGTRIGHCMHDFNRFWSRRVSVQGAVVLFVSDGLDREGGAQLDMEMSKLQRSCRRLIWLNPLLRYDQFEPKTSGIRAIWPHVDEVRTVHNLESLLQLVEVLNQPAKLTA